MVPQTKDEVIGLCNDNLRTEYSCLNFYCEKKHSHADSVKFGLKNPLFDKKVHRFVKKATILDAKCRTQRLPYYSMPL